LDIRLAQPHTVYTVFNDGKRPVEHIVIVLVILVSLNFQNKSHSPLQIKPQIDNSVA
jgi:hypothetical protein